MTYKLVRGLVVSKMDVEVNKCADTRNYKKSNMESQTSILHQSKSLNFTRNVKPITQHLIVYLDVTAFLNIPLSPGIGGSSSIFRFVLRRS